MIDGDACSAASCQALLTALPRRRRCCWGHAASATRTCMSTPAMQCSVPGGQPLAARQPSRRCAGMSVACSNCTLCCGPPADLAVSTCCAAVADLSVTTRQAAGSAAPTRPLEGAECAICFDELTDGASAAQRAVATCTSCGNHLHKEVSILLQMSVSLPHAGCLAAC